LGPLFGASGSGTSATDFGTLGVDANGLYLAIVQDALAVHEGNTVVAIKKPEIYNGTFISTNLEIFNTNNPTPVWAIQPAINFDNVASNGFAFFVAKGPHSSGTNYPGGPIVYRRLYWTNAANGLVRWADTNWITITNTPGVTYQDYFDFDASETNAPQMGGTKRIGLEASSALSMTTIRNGALWTSHAVGLSGTNGIYEPGKAVDRSAVQWLKTSADAATGSLSYITHGRVYDRTNSTNAFYYYFPSLAVNCAGDMVVGFSGSSATSYISAYCSWRLANGSTLAMPHLIRAGTVYYGDARGGDYSATTPDPTDPWAFWTVQAYSHPAGYDDLGGGLPWVTVISRIRPDP
jgi:hypothetical protein